MTKRRYEHAERIHFHGPFDRADLPKILAKADLGLMLSIEEGYGLVAWEYMACGLPFVMTDCGAAPEFTQGNPDVIMVPVSLEGIRRGIEEMARRLRSGQVSRRRLQKFHQDKFSFEIGAAEHVKTMLGPNDYWSS
jgi:glycosyltransferase involved in cell wall biosynthesis